MRPSRFQTLYGKPGREYIDSVVEAHLVDQVIETLLRFETLGSWATSFLRGLMASENDPIASAWFLTLVVRASTWLFFSPPGEPASTRCFIEEQLKAAPGAGWAFSEVQARSTHKYPQELILTRPVLASHFGVIRSSGQLFSSYPTYWRDLFKKLEALDFR